MKRCSKCRERKASSEFYVQRVGKTGHPILSGECKACRAVYFAQWERRNREKRTAQKREWARRKRAADPEWHAAKLAYDREWGRVNRGYSSRDESASRTMAVVDVRPFAAWLQDATKRHGTIRELANITGIHEDKLRQIMAGKQASVSIDTVDRALIADGGTTRLEQLYPLG